MRSHRNHSPVLIAILGIGIVLTTALAITSNVQSHRDAARAIQGEQTARLILESSPVAIVACDDKGRVIAFNQKAESLTGRSAMGVIGGPMDEMIPKDQREAHRTAFKRAAETISLGSRGWVSLGKRKVDLLRVDGGIVEVYLSIRGVKSADGVMFIATFTPVSDAPLTQASR